MVLFFAVTRLRLPGNETRFAQRTDIYQKHNYERGATRKTTHWEAGGRRVPCRASTGIGHSAAPAARDFFGPKFNDLSSHTSLSSHARGHGSLSGKNFLRPSMTAFPASHSGASGASGQIIVGAALPLRRRAVGNAPRCGTRAWAVAIHSSVSFMAFVWQVLAVLMRATRVVDDRGTAH